MDIRVKKTRRAIQKAFVELLREKPFEKITVREIAERAEVNKSTFYAHYETLDALIAQLEQQTVQQVVEQMRGAQLLLEQPEEFVEEMFRSLQQSSEFLVAIPTSALQSFNQHLRDAILEQAKREKLEVVQYENVGAILIFLMSGLSGLLRADPALAQKQLPAIAALVADGIHGGQLSR